ncbi:MAG: hypothetical protein VW874_06420, partial [Gammaproteobacteria bacterium]
MKTMRKLATVLTVVCMLFVMSTSVYAAKVETKLQNQIRSSVPFPEFLSTGPYVWYEDAKN